MVLKLTASPPAMPTVTHSQTQSMHLSHTDSDTLMQHEESAPVPAPSLLSLKRRGSRDYSDASQAKKQHNDALSLFPSLSLPHAHRTPLSSLSINASVPLRPSLSLSLDTTVHGSPSSSLSASGTSVLRVKFMHSPVSNGINDSTHSTPIVKTVHTPEPSIDPPASPATTTHFAQPFFRARRSQFSLASRAGSAHEALHSALDLHDNLATTGDAGIVAFSLPPTRLQQLPSDAPAFQLPESPCLSPAMKRDSAPYSPLFAGQKQSKPVDDDSFTVRRFSLADGDDDDEEIEIHHQQRQQQLAPQSARKPRRSNSAFTFDRAMSIDNNSDDDLPTAISHQPSVMPPATPRKTIAPRSFLSTSRRPFIDPLPLPAGIPSHSLPKPQLPPPHPHPPISPTYDPISSGHHLALSFPTLPLLDTGDHSDDSILSSSPLCRTPVHAIPVDTDSPPRLLMSRLLSPHPNIQHLTAVTSMAAMSPDPKAFLEANELRKKTPRATLIKPCPPTPMRLKPPTHLIRTSSLYENKVLADDSEERHEGVGVCSANGHSHTDDQHTIVSHSCPASPFPSSCCSTPTPVGVSTPLLSEPRRVSFESDFADVSQIGEGSFFHVFRAIEKSTGQLCAIKRTQRPLRGRAERSSYMREVHLLKILGCHQRSHSPSNDPHPHIIGFKCAWQEDLHFFIQLEHCQSSLTQYTDELAKRGERASDPQLLQWCYELCLALAHVHKHQILHLDIKPDNILIDSTGAIKLGDFGQARLIDEISDGSEGDSRYAALELLQIKHTKTNNSLFSQDMFGDTSSSANQLFVGGELTVRNKFLHTPGSQCLPLPSPGNASPLSNASSLSSSSSPTNSITNTTLVRTSRYGVSYGTDMFSVGLSMLELASQTELPKEGRVWLQLREGHALPHVVDKVSSPVITQLILDCLDPDVTKRPSAAQLCERLRPIIIKEGTVAISPS